MAIASTKKDLNPPSFQHFYQNARVLNIIKGKYPKRVLKLDSNQFKRMIVGLEKCFLPSPNLLLTLLRGLNWTYRAFFREYRIFSVQRDTTKFKVRIASFPVLVPNFDSLSRVA